MKIYLAAPYAARERVKDYAAELTRVGFTVTSSWLDEKHDIKPETVGAATGLNDAQASTHVETDLRDIDRSDLLVLFTERAVGVDGSSGGRHVETGYALAIGYPVLVVGEPENIFHRSTRRVTCVPDWHEAVVELSHRLVDYHRAAPSTPERAS